jgi:ABC-type uncharacterized transport system ATPase subunit
MSSEIIIQTNDLSVYYGAHRGIKDLNLSVQKGEVFRILGAEWGWQNNHAESDTGYYPSHTRQRNPIRT